jgi:AraC-like DNA-binding protein
MLHGPTALAMTLAPLRDALQGTGVDFDALARRAGLDPEALRARPNARVPSARIQKLWRLAGEATRDPLLGLRAGSLVRPGTLHALGLGIVSSSSVLSALKRIERYSGILSTNGRFVLTERDGFATLEAQPTSVTVPPAEQWFDAMVVSMCRMLAICAGPAATPVKVRLPHGKREHADGYRKVLHCPVEFGAERAALVFDAQLAVQPVHSGNRELAAEADRIANSYLEGLAPGSVAMRVRSLLVKAMPSGDVDQDAVARALNQSPSTLQRRLRREGTSYQRVLDTTRRELALQYLRDGQHSLADVAFLLGFADQSNFTRAFRRWTGKTPRQYLS